MDYKNKKLINKSKLFLICFAIMFSSSSVIYSQSIHAIIAGATNEDNKIISEGIQIDLKAIENEIDLIGENTNLSVKYYKLTGGDFNSESLLNAIHTIHCSNNDIIFFYYSGHGFRYNNQSDKWPILAVDYNINSIRDAHQHGVPLLKIINQLKQKAAKLTIILADCCNSETTYLPPIDKEDKGIATLSFSLRSYERYSDLYLNSEGLIVASSSLPGQPSSINNTYGSIYTNSFLEVHKELTSISNTARWDDIFEKSKERTIKLSNLHDKKQIPQFEIRITTNYNNPNINWNGVIASNSGAYRNMPNNFQNNNPYINYQFPIARVVMFNNNRIFFLMSDNYIVEPAPYTGSLTVRGYRAFSAEPGMFQWDIVNPIGPYNTIIYGVDYSGMIWSWDNYNMRWVNVGVAYY